MEKYKVPKKILVSLIKDDLVNSRLVYGLDSMGIDASQYTLRIIETIFRLMNLESSKQIDQILENYIDLTRRAKTIDIARSHDELNKLAIEIYTFLVIMEKVENEV